jgi:DNA-binding NtrC family response regulator
METKRRLLVAEDDLEMRTLLKRVLMREGFEVETAANGREAVELLQLGRRYDLIISDIRMPEKDGEQLLKEAQVLRPGLKVVLVTSWGELDQCARLRQQGAFDYLTKPFKIPDLLDVIDRAMEVTAQ